MKISVVPSPTCWWKVQRSFKSRRHWSFLLNNCESRWGQLERKHKTAQTQLKSQEALKPQLIWRDAYTLSWVGVQARTTCRLSEYWLYKSVWGLILSENCYLVIFLTSPFWRFTAETVIVFYHCIISVLFQVFLLIFFECNSTQRHMRLNPRSYRS